MSVIVAIRRESRTVVASDTLAYDGVTLQPQETRNARPKLRRLGKVILGTAGYAVYDDILDDYLATGNAVPNLSDAASVFAFFLGFWRALHERYHLVNDQPEEEDREMPFATLDSRFLIASSRAIITVDGDLGITEYTRYWAIGAGLKYALGVLHALYDSDLSIDDIARKAIEAAGYFDPYCGGCEVLELE